MKVASLTDHQFQLEPSDLSSTNSLLAVASEMYLWGYSLTLLAEDGLYRQRLAS